jgi:hypothetical protein
MAMFLDEAWRKPLGFPDNPAPDVPNSEDISTWLRWRNLDLNTVSYWQQIKIPALVKFIDRQQLSKGMPRSRGRWASPW